MINMSPAEKAYIESGGAVHPDTGKAATEESDGTSGTDAGSGGGDGAVVEREVQPPEATNTDGETEGADAEGDEDEITEVADGTNPDGAARRKVIAFGAYDKQRAKAQKLSSELEQTKQQLAYLTGLVQQGRQAPQTGQQPNQPAQLSTTPPDPQKEPQKWLDWVNQTLSKAAEAQQVQQKTTAEQQQIQQLNHAAYEAEQDFIAQGNADYYDALKHLDKSRRDELKMLGYDAATAQQIIEAQNKDIAIRAFNSNANPAERFYAMSKARGFKAPAPTKTETEAEKVARQAKNQQSDKSIGKLAGGASKSGLSIEDLANLSQDEFNKKFKDGSAQKILGIPM